MLLYCTTAKHLVTIVIPCKEETERCVLRYSYLIGLWCFAKCYFSSVIFRILTVEKKNSKKIGISFSSEPPSAKGRGGIQTRDLPHLQVPPY